ncbi:TetR/AcrR family transcriptional regulator [Nocardia australiensis]|uniref:TetR/AcrR family transcriptional regulator n=1 Tax=Nocardia australiensis TaxID=2887191 RepID=UPI001D13EEB2|nr:TetR/AcrR family transcriptional regulator [Nocardia australiensis]
MAQPAYRQTPNATGSYQMPYGRIGGTMATLTSVAPERLPRGPHGLSRDQVATSQRDRLCMAALEAVSELGYGPTTIGDIVSRARVARRAFYALFDSKEECFTASFDFAVDVVTRKLDRVVAEAGASTFADLVRTTLTAYLDCLVAEPAAARALHIETLAAGPGLLAHRTRVQQMYANRMMAAARIGVREGVLRAVPDPQLINMLTGGIDDRVRATLIESGPGALRELTPTFNRAALALLGAA